ncbi:MAG: acetyltransferase [Pseudomonadota bacterium]
MKRILIIGVGGNCIDILDILHDINASRTSILYECIGFLDDDPQTHNADIQGLRVLGPLDSARRHLDCYFINGIGSPDNFWYRDKIILQTGVTLERFETIIHPTASISRSARIGRGTVIFPHVTVASGAIVGHQVTILPNSVISHDGIIKDYTCIASGACISGGVEVGRLCYLGTNCAITGNVKIGDCCLIGMGSVVLHDVPSNSVVAGNPARLLRKTH